MKYILTILFFLTAYFVNAQYIPNSAAYQYKGLKQTNSLQPPTGTAFPVTATNAPDSNYAAWYYNKTDTAFYQWNPVPHTWTKLQSNGGITVSIDSVFITSIDSIFITNTDSIFIISGNDTIYIGNSNPAVDTIYQRTDSIFAVKSGVEFLAALTGAATPSGGMDTAYQRGDSLFGVKNNTEFLVGLVGGAPTGVPGTKDTLWYNVKWFGAIGDGVTDDRAAIQSANDYVSAVKGGYIWFPAGVYKVSAPVYRASYVNWEGVKDSSIIKNFNPTHVTFGDQSVMWMGNYNPSAYDTTVGRFFRGHMGTLSNKMAIVDSISRFAVGDVVVIEGMTGWTSNDGHWKPYVTRINEIDSIIPGTDTVVFHYQMDTILTNARINISGHFIDPNDGIDGNGHVKYLVRNVTTRNMVFESEGQWILGMSSLGCSWENIRIKAAELFTGNGMAWTTARNIYGQWWRQVSEFAIGSHNTIITGVNAHYINRSDPDAKPYIKFGENVHAIVLKDFFIDAGNFDGNGVWFGAATECVVDGIHVTSQRLRQTHIEFSDNDLGDAPASFVNNNILRHGYFKNYGSLNNYILMNKSISAGQLRNNVVSDVTFAGPVNDATALTIDGYRTEFRDLYTTEGEIVGGDSLYKGIISGGSIANVYDIHGNDSNIFIRSVFDTAGKNRSHFTDIILKYVPDNTTIDGQLHYNQSLDQLNFRHNGTTTDLLAAGGSTPFQHLTNGYGILPFDFDGSAPQTVTVDSSILNGDLFIDSSTTEFFVDTISVSPPVGAVSGATVLVAHTGATGAFATHEDQIATLTGAVWSFQIAAAGDNLVLSNDTQPTTFYQFDGSIWHLRKRAASIGGDAIGTNYDLGTNDNQNFRFFTNGFLRERISSGGQHYFRRYVGITSNNYLKIADTATGRMDFDTFVIQKVKFPIGLNEDTIYHKASGVTAGSYTNLNATIDSNGHVTAASNGSAGGGGSVSSIATTAPITGGTITTTGTIGITQSTTSTNGYLSSTDWNTFNNKFSLPSLTSGSVLFSNGTTISQNNSNFFWDNSNTRLGIGTATPTNTLHIGGDVRINTLSTGVGGTDSIIGVSGGVLNRIPYSALIPSLRNVLIVGKTADTAVYIYKNGLGNSNPTVNAFIAADTTVTVSTNQVNISPAYEAIATAFSTAGSTNTQFKGGWYVEPVSGGGNGFNFRWYSRNATTGVTTTLLSLASQTSNVTTGGTLIAGVAAQAPSFTGGGANISVIGRAIGTTGNVNPSIALNTGITHTATSGSVINVAVFGNYNEASSSANNLGTFWVNNFEQSLSSGSQYALRYTTSTATNGGGSLTDKWFIANTGTMNAVSGNIGAYVAKTGTYTILGTDETIECTSGTFTLTLPTAVGRSGQKYFITNSGSGTITLATTSSQTFVNVTATPTSLSLAQFDTKIIISNGANWLAK